MKTLTCLPIAWFVLSIAACSSVFADDALVPNEAEELLAGEATVEATADSEVWLFNTRHLPCPQNACEPTGKPRIYQRQGGNWLLSTPETFYGTANPNQITCFYVHGNRISPSEARRRGIKLYRLLGGTDAPIRFVIWSWNSGEVRGRIRDARVKAGRADRESFQLACSLSQLPNASTVSLIGYSFGARIVAGSLHILAGGQFCGNSLPPDRLPAYRPRAILLAGALSNGWIRPGGSLGLMMSKVDHMYSTINHRDPALKRFYVTTKASKPKALGYTGIARQSLGPNSHLVTQHDVSRAVGWTHRFDRHIESGPVMSHVRRYALWNPVQ